MKWPVRYRIALTLSVALAALVVVYAVSLLLVARQRVISELDRRLEIEAYVTADLIRLSPAESSEYLRLRDIVEAEELESSVGSMDLEVRQGPTLIYSRRPDISQSFLQNLPHDRDSSGLATQQVNGRSIRVLQLEFNYAGASWLVRVAEDERESLDSLSSLRLAVLVGTPLVVALMALLSYWLARRALEPLERIARQIGSISAGSLEHRVSVPESDDEIARLAAGFNALLARLQAAFAEMRRFTADASHELRTPLTVIQAIGEFAVSNKMTTEEYRDTIGNMLEEVARLTQLAEALLMLARGEEDGSTLTETQIEPREVVEAVCAQLRPLAEDRDQVLSVRGATSSPIWTDANLVRLAVMNVVYNAIKFTPNGGRIDVEVSCRDAAIAMTVDDTGPGIPAELRDKIFDRFYRAERPQSSGRRGFGLGLSIARTAITKLGGTISAGESASGGARISIFIPRKDRDLL